MSNTPSKAEIEALVKRHGATSYRNRADTQHPAYGFTEDGLNGLIDEVLAKWGTPQQEAQEPVATLHCNDIGYVWARATEVGTRMRFEQPINLYTAPQPAPQQEAQEPSHRETVDVVGVRSNGEHVNLEKIAMPPRMKAREIAIEQFGSFKDDDGSDAEMCFGALEYFLEWLIQQGWSKAPQPAPAPLSEPIDQLERALAIIGVVGAIDGHDVVRRESVLEIARRAAIAAQGGK